MKTLHRSRTKTKKTEMKVKRVRRTVSLKNRINGAVMFSCGVVLLYVSAGWIAHPLTCDVGMFEFVVTMECAVLGILQGVSLFFSDEWWS